VPQFPGPSQFSCAWKEIVLGGVISYIKGQVHKVTSAITWLSLGLSMIPASIQNTGLGPASVIGDESQPLASQSCPSGHMQSRVGAQDQGLHRSWGCQKVADPAHGGQRRLQGSAVLKQVWKEKQDLQRSTVTGGRRQQQTGWATGQLRDNPRDWDEG
jgi:hypothetical protein